MSFLIFSNVVHDFFMSVHVFSDSFLFVLMLFQVLSSGFGFHVLSRVHVLSDLFGSLFYKLSHEKTVLLSIILVG